MNLVTLSKLNALRFSVEPVPEQKLQRWCRAGTLPARKIGGEWYVDLDEFDRKPHELQTVSPVILAVDKLRARGTH